MNEYWWLSSKLEYEIRREIPAFTTIIDARNLASSDIEKMDEIISLFLQIDPQLGVYYENPKEIEDNFEELNKILFEDFKLTIPKNRLIATGIASTMLQTNKTIYFELLDQGIYCSDESAHLLFEPTDPNEMYSDLRAWEGKVTDKIFSYIEEFASIVELKSDMYRYVAYYCDSRSEIGGMYITVFYANNQSPQEMHSILSRVMPEKKWIVVA